MRLNKTEIVMLFYLFITGILLLFVKNAKTTSFFITNITLAFIIFLISFFDGKSKRISFIRTIYPIFLLGHFYTETYILNHLFFKHNLDSFFISADRFIFGFQPSLLFYQTFPFPWLNNLMFFAYLSFLFMPLTFSLLFYFFKRRYTERFIFLLISSFVCYYLIFIILPVVGPQFYFSGKTAITPALGFFGKAVKFVQKYAEHPTGAFPSSHVGISIIITIYLFKKFRILSYFVMPITFLILFATVYIKAHYAIDVIAGIISAPIIYVLSKQLWTLLDSIKETYLIITPKFQNKLKKILFIFIAK